MNLYFVISQFDTDADVTVFDKQGLIKEMEIWKDEYIHPHDVGKPKFIQSIDELEEGNPAEWEGKRLIIKGTIVVPKPKKVIETFEIE